MLDCIGLLGRGRFSCKKREGQGVTWESLNVLYAARRDTKIFKDTRNCKFSAFQKIGEFILLE